MQTNRPDLQAIFHFRSGALPDDTFNVVSFCGEEEISRPFRFDIELVSENPAIDLDQVIYQTAFLSMERTGGRSRKIHGVLAEFEQKHEDEEGLYHYRAVLVPRLELLSLTRQNRIYQNITVPDIIQKALFAENNKGAVLAASGAFPDYFEFRLERQYPRREYVVQYQETDLDFISRLMEHEGISYFFEHGDQREKIIFADSNKDFPSIAGRDNIAYRSPSALKDTQEESVHSVSCKHKPVPQRVILKDYNYRSPHMPLQAEAFVDTIGTGMLSEYGNHFKEPEEGAVLARIRAEEMRCRQKIFAGTSNSVLFEPGRNYTLDNHFRPDFDREYLITRVKHEGRRNLSKDLESSEDNGADRWIYCNEFSSIPSDITFRPERKTRKPRLTGIMNAYVDGAGMEERAEMDDQGRYKVVMPFDLSGAGEGKASRYIRMAQPYGGKNQGMHFPLHKGTEVIVTCIDGDPDRPIITGTVPNPLNPSVVTKGNAAKNVIKTAGGVLMEFGGGVAASIRDEHPRESSCGDPLALQGHTPSISQTGSGLQDLKQQQQYQNQEDVTVTVSNAKAEEGNKLVFTIALSEAPQNNKTDVTISTTDGTAIAGTNYEAPENNSLTFKSDETVKTVEITTLEEGIPSPLAMTLKAEIKDGDQVISSHLAIGTILRASTTEESDETGTEPDIWFRVHVPKNQNETNGSYLRLGETPTDNKEEDLLNGIGGQDKLNLNKDDLNGIFSYTDGNRTEVTVGDSEEHIVGKRRLTIGSGGANVWDANPHYYLSYRPIFGGDETYWRKTEIEMASADTYKIGDNESFFGGFTHDTFTGLKSSTTLSSSLSLNAGILPDIGFSIGNKIDFGCSGFDWNYSKGYHSRTAAKITNHARKTIEFEIKPGDMSWKKLNMFAGVIGGVGALLGNVGAGVSAGLTAGTKDPKFDSIGATASVGSMMVGIYATLFVLVLVERRKNRIKAQTTATKIKMDKDKIELKCGKLFIELFKGGSINIGSKQIHKGISLCNDGQIHLYGNVIIHGKVEARGAMAIRKNLDVYGDVNCANKAILGIPPQNKPQGKGNAPW